MLLLRPGLLMQRALLQHCRLGVLPPLLLMELKLLMLLLLLLMLLLLTKHFLLPVGVFLQAALLLLHRSFPLTALLVLLAQ